MKDTKKDAPGLMICREAAIMLSLLPDEDAGQAIKAAVNCFLHGMKASNLEDPAALVFEYLKDSGGI